MDKRYLVFAIDDDPVYQQMIMDELSEQANLRTQGFSTGEEALNNLYLKPDIIVLDYYLNNNNPDAKNGLKILEEIQEQSPSSQIIALSGQLMPDITFEFIMKKGVYSYIVKDANAFENLNDAITTIIDDIENQ